MKRFLLAFVAIAFIAGCAGAPVGYGGTTAVVFADKDMIKVQWDNMVSNEDAARTIALNHCAATKRGVQMVDGSSDPMTMGLVRTRTWKCTN